MCIEPKLSGTHVLILCIICGLSLKLYTMYLMSVLLQEALHMLDDFCSPCVCFVGIVTKSVYPYCRWN
jgi:hypothetical protein